MKAVEPQRNTGGRFVMTADPAILKRIRGCPFARGGRVLVRFRANGYSLFARRSGEPLARLRLTGNGDEVVLLYPSHRGGWGALGDFGASAMSLDKALQYLSDNPYFLDLRETYGRAATADRCEAGMPFPGNYSLISAHLNGCFTMSRAAALSSPDDRLFGPF